MHSADVASIIVENGTPKSWPPWLYGVWIVGVALLWCGWHLRGPDGLSALQVPLWCVAGWSAVFVKTMLVMVLMLLCLSVGRRLCEVVRADDGVLGSILGMCIGLLIAFHPGWSYVVVSQPTLLVASVLMMWSLSDAILVVSSVAQQWKFAPWLAGLMAACLCPSLLGLWLAVTALLAMRWWRRYSVMPRWAPAIFACVVATIVIHMLGWINPWHVDYGLLRGPLDSIAIAWSSARSWQGFAVTGMAVADSVGPIVLLLAIAGWVVAATTSRRSRLIGIGAAMLVAWPCVLHSAGGFAVALVLATALLTAIGILYLAWLVNSNVGRWMLIASFGAVTVAGFMLSW
jgi:hypothetical protein